MSYFVPVNLTIIISLVIFIFYILGIHQVLVGMEENACEMTYMFEYPQYVEISLSPTIKQSYPRYALYGYGEGVHTVQVRKMKFNGLPVLFIPGSGGTYKQGRSLASVSLRKWVSSRTQYRFDYFMVDFDEESSGLHGGLLEEQTKFVRHCIEKILSIYRSEGSLTKPTSVILIGHSYGGLVAKGIFMEKDWNPQSVQLLITLASPNKHPLFQPDPYIANYYKTVEVTWKNNANLSHISYASIGGGARDLIVRSDAIHDPDSQINVLSTAIPGVWCSNDHQSIVWCKQLVLTIVRALFDCVDVNTRKLSTDVAYRNSVLKYHLLKRSAGKRFALSHHARFASFDKGGNWIENLQRQFTVMESKGLKVNHYIMVRLLADPKHESAFIETFNLNTKDWIFVCNADVVYNSVRMCETGENISNSTEIAPTKKLRRKFVHLNLLELRKKSFTHVVIKLPPSDSFVRVNVDVHRISDRNLIHQVPSVFALSGDVIINNTQDNAVYYSVMLNGFDAIWQAYIFGLEVLSCKTATSHAVISFTVPWAAEDSHYFSVDKASLSTVLKLSTPRPPTFNRTSFPVVKLHLDPSCKYKVTIKASFIGRAAQVARYYTPMLPAFLAAILLLTVRQQMLSLDEGTCIAFHSALALSTKRYYIILQIVVIGSKVLGLGFFLKHLPVPDFFILEELNLDFFALIIVLYGVAVALTTLLGLLCYLSIVLGGGAAHKMALRFIAKTITGVISWSEWVFSALHQVPIVVASILVSLAMSTAGAVALWLGTGFYFLKLCKMYENYLEELFKMTVKMVAGKLKNVAKRKGTSVKNGDAAPEVAENHVQLTENDKKEGDESQGTEKPETDKPPATSVKISSEASAIWASMNFHISIFLLWLLAATLQIPSLLIWARNYQYSVLLKKDPALVPSIIFSVCGAILWQDGVPYSCRKLSRVTSTTLFILAAITIMYSSLSMYRLGYMLSAAVVLLTLTQIISKLIKSDN